jgi:lipopolysaccharide transport system permease protein
LPISSVLAGLLDFVIAFLVLIGMMFYYGITPGLNAIWALPLFLLLAIVTALGVALWLSAVNVQYRDVGYALPFLSQFWMFVTPIAYSSSVISEQWQMVYALNPMAGVVNGFRWALLGVPKGNGKSPLAAALALYHLLGDPGHRPALGTASSQLQAPDENPAATLGLAEGRLHPGRNRRRHHPVRTGRLR